MVKIISVAGALPRYSRTTSEILPYFEKWLAGKDERFVKKAKKIFEGAAVDHRYSIMSPEQIFTLRSFEARNRLYCEAATELGIQALSAALAKVQWPASSIDFLITVSCTGIMIPSLDAFLINRMQMKQDVVRLPVTEMGCVGGVSGLIYSKLFLQANPGKRAAVIAVESPTATFQLDDFDMANIVSAAIFGDGAACALLSSRGDDAGAEVVAESMYHFYNSEEMMGFQMTNSGFKMVLSPEVPETISAHFDRITVPFLNTNRLTASGLDHLIFHPGGKKIIQTVDALFGALGKNIDATKAVLRRYGNMSSATVLFVLELIMEQAKKGETGLMLSFGPGFTAQQLLLKW